MKNVSGSHNFLIIKIINDIICENFILISWYKHLLLSTFIPDVLDYEDFIET